MSARASCLIVLFYAAVSFLIGAWFLGAVLLAWCAFYWHHFVRSELAARPSEEKKP